ncbi:uncharacterized protein A1O9_08907, partial [Exophiala aquamarina CBS 119918]
KNVAAHTRSHSTNATLKQPAGTQVSSQASTARIPGKNLDRTQTPATSAQHRRNLSALTSTRVARPEQSANWPKARPVCGVPKDHASTASLNGTTLTRPIFDNSKQLSIPQKAKQSISVANSTLSTNLNAEGVGGSDFSRIGDELLQLSLLHESSASTFQQYTNSVINHLKDQHAGLEIQHQQLESRERDRQTQVNLRGIRKWFDQNSGSSDVSLNPLSLLAECTHELEDLSKGDGDFSAAMKQFDDWKLGADIAMTSCGTSEETEVRFVVPISPDWRNLIMSLDTKLKMYMNTLRDFRKGNESTAIDEMITMLSVLGQSLLQEIEICKTLEGLILQRQQRWIDSSIEKALLAVRADSSQAFQLTVRKGIWEDI